MAIKSVDNCYQTGYKVHPEHLLQEHNEFVAEYLNAIPNGKTGNMMQWTLVIGNSLKIIKINIWRKTNFFHRKTFFLFEAVFICILYIKVKKHKSLCIFVCRNASTAANKGTPYFLCLCNSVVCTALDLWNKWLNWFGYINLIYEALQSSFFCFLNA